MLLPKEYHDVRIIAVITGPANKHMFLDVPQDLIERHKARKGGVYTVTVSRIEPKRFVTGRDTWPLIKSFSELT